MMRHADFSQYCLHSTFTMLKDFTRWVDGGMKPLVDYKRPPINPTTKLLYQNTVEPIHAQLKEWYYDHG